MSLAYYKLIVAYNGANFYGWQEQPKNRTIQGVLKSTFKNIFNANCSIVGASRTDTGVHANYQTVRINTKINIDPKRLKFAWSNALPSDISIKSLEKLEDSSQFHPQHNILEKTYHYDFYLGQSDPFFNITALHWTWNINLEKLENALKCFVGKKDFRSFCSSQENTKDTVRTINSIYFYNVKRTEYSQLYRIKFKGKSFLHNMIRRIVGACLEAATKNLSLDVLQKALEEKNPRQALLNAPAHGLMLHNIKYNQAITSQI